MRNKKKENIDRQAPSCRGSRARDEVRGKIPALSVKSLFALAAAVIAFAPPAQAKLVDEIALVVDQDSMTRGELEESIQTFFLAQSLKPARPGTPEYTKAKKEVEDSFVREVLLAEEADREKIEISDSELDHSVDQELDNMRKNFSSEQDFQDGLKKEGLTLDDLKQEIHDKLLRRLKASRVMRQKQVELPATALVADADMRQYYDRHPEDFEQVKFSIILFRVHPKAGTSYVSEVEKQAQAVLKNLKAGADFAATAKKYSEDQGTAEKGGEVGMVSRADLNPELAGGVFAIPVNGMGLVKADQGVYIVKVEYKGKADYVSVAPEIKARLEKEKQETALTRWIDSLRKDATILEDGKPVPYQPSLPPEEAAAGAVSTPGKAPAATPTAETILPAAAASTAAGPSDIYPSLPSVGGWTYQFSLSGFNYGTQDLANYVPGVQTNQNFPFGFGLATGMDYSLESTFQVGLGLEALRKNTESVDDTLSNFTYKWDSAAAGPALDLKLLIPMDESTNFIISASAGYYFLLGSTLSVSGPGSEKAELSASNWGGKAGGVLEFLLDDHKNSALDLGVDYRLLSFSPVTTKVTSDNGGPALASPLLNPDGKQADIDFSGIEVNLGLRFFLGKDYDKETPNF